MPNARREFIVPAASQDRSARVLVLFTTVAAVVLPMPSHALRT